MSCALRQPDHRKRVRDRLADDTAQVQRHCCETRRVPRRVGRLSCQQAADRFGYVRG
jgi:hypothetical protein